MRVRCDPATFTRSAGGDGGDSAVLYLIGELSLLLSNVSAVATADANVEEALRLRMRAETSAPEDLTAVAVSALRLTDVLCLMSLSRGDTTAFTAQVEASRGLYEFGVCSGLFDEF